MSSFQKVPKFDFQIQFSMSEIIGVFLIFFFIEEYNLGAHFFLLTFFDNINFKSLYFLYNIYLGLGFEFGIYPSCVRSLCYKLSLLLIFFS